MNVGSNAASRGMAVLDRIRLTGPPANFFFEGNPRTTAARFPLPPVICRDHFTTIPGMPMEFDHVFVCTAPGAPAADKLVQFGLSEGSQNQHPGQGTACRRFPFANAMVELLWVTDVDEAQSQTTKRTLLWERWSGRQHHASPFGICMRPADSEDVKASFLSWIYRPAYLEGPLFMSIGEAGVEEPMWVYLSFMRRAFREQHFLEHPIGIREITGLTLTTPVMLRSEASQKIVESGILITRMGARSVLEIEFDGGRRNELIDFQPDLPLVFRM